MIYIVGDKENATPVKEALGLDIIASMDSPSGVPDQPKSEYQALKGAYNRARNASLFSNRGPGVGIENFGSVTYVVIYKSEHVKGWAKKEDLATSVREAHDLM